MSVLFGQVVRGLSAGSRVFEVDIYEPFPGVLKICRIFSLTLKILENIAFEIFPALNLYIFTHIVLLQICKLNFVTDIIIIIISIL